MEDLKKRLEAVRQKINPTGLKEEIFQIQSESGRPEFWQDQSKAAEKMKRMADLQKEIDELEELEKLFLAGDFSQVEKKLKKVELKTFFSGEHDKSFAIFSIHAGQGGTEAMDWANMLKRMYLRYFEKKGWSNEIADETSGDEAGIKSVTMKVDAPYAYGYLKYEAGTHRLVRQSPFNADKLRQTSFALVEVLPQVGDVPEIQVSESDLDWQFTHSSGHGGQNVQKVATAVRLLHKPTGIIINCQTQRYQEQNRKIALELLQAKLWGLQQTQAEKDKQKLKGGRTMAAWGTQIRSYVLHPYKMVKDLRSGYETSNAEAILDGELDEMIEAEVKSMV